MTPRARGFAWPQRRRLAHLFTIAAVILGVWALVGLYNASEFYRTARAIGGEPDWGLTLRFHMIMSLNWALWTPLTVFITERLPLDRDKPWRSLRSLVTLAALVPVLAFARAVWGGAVLDLSEGRLPRLAFLQLSVGIRLHSYIVMIAAIVIVTILLDKYRESRAGEQSALALQAAVADAEAEHLRAQLQPALVFDTLTAIRARVRTDPRTADRMIVRLAELLRRGLDRRTGGDASIEDELDHTDRYVELQRFRFGADIATRSIIDDDVLAARVPPLALQTLIDTALSTTPPRLIELRGNTSGNALQLQARVEPSLFISLGERSARLRDWFGPDCHTTLSFRDGAVVATVELPLEYVA
ncbi:MAG TPA: histidine kinase [Thermoanaerobaculia bacterium]|jgi:hypothetical protein